MDRARLLAHFAHAGGDGAAVTARGTIAREIGRLPCTVTRSDRHLKDGGWIQTRRRQGSRLKRLPNVTQLLFPGELGELDAEIRRRLVGATPTPIAGLRDDDVYVALDGTRRVRSVLVFGWELEHPDVQAILESPVAGQVWLALRSLLAAGPRTLSRLSIAVSAGLVAPDDVLYAEDDTTDAVRAARCADARKRVSEAIVGLEARGLLTPRRRPGAPSEYHLPVPRGCEVYLPALAALTPRAWGGEPSRAAEGDGAPPSGGDGSSREPSPSPARDVSVRSELSGHTCPSCARPAHFDRAIPREGWLDFCFDPAHGQTLPRCPHCDTAVDGELVTFDPGSGTLACRHCSAVGLTSTVAPARRAGGSGSEPMLEDGPPPAQRQVTGEASGRVVQAYLESLPASVRGRRRTPRPLEDELDAARALVAQGGVAHALWCARRLAARAGAGAFLPADALQRVLTTA